MREQFLPDGSRDYGQGVIGPSAQDIAFFKNPNRPPLDHFPTRQALTTTAIIVTPFAVSGCVSVTPASTEGNQNLADTQTSDPNGEASIGDRFDAFLAKYDGQDIGQRNIVSIWVDSLGISSDEIHDFLYDAGPFERFNNPPDYIKEKYEVILNDNWDKLPQKGDIIFTYPNSNNSAGIMIVAAEKAKKDPDGTRHGKVFANYNVDTQDFRTGWIPRVQDFNVENAIAWLKPKDIVEIDGEGDQGNDILVARTESIADHFQSFKDRYDGQFVEKNDTSNLNQCMDLVTAWADELGIPRDAVTGILYAKNLYLSPKQSTKDYFDIIPYEEGLTPQVGDVVVWDEGIGGVAGHAAISNGDSSANEWLSTFSQNYPTGTESHAEDFNFDHILGWLRPKGFDSAPRTTEPPAIPEFVPETPLDWARYQFGKRFFDFLSRDYKAGYLEQDLGLTDTRREEIIQALARGEEVALDEPIVYRWAKTKDNFETSVGIAYFNNLQISEERPWGYEVSSADMENGIDFRGELEISLIVKFGIRYGPALNGLNKEKQYEKISNFSSWLDASVWTIATSGPNYSHYENSCLGQEEACLRSGSIFNFMEFPYGTNREGGPGFEKVEQ